MVTAITIWIFSTVMMTIALVVLVWGVAGLVMGTRHDNDED